MKELSIEEKAKAYDGNYKAYTELINRLEDVKDAIKKQNYGIAMDILCKPYPEYQIITSTESEESEDEKIRKALINGFNKLDKSAVWYNGITNGQILAWLEKQGEQEQAWSEEDEKMLNACTELIGNTISANYGEEDGVTIDTCRNWLKSLRDRVFLQPQQEWSEEDEKFVHGLIRGLSAKRDIYGHTTFSSDGIDITKTIDWLKSLKERYAWKPSDEQMITLRHVISGCSYDIEPLVEIEKHLKKLRKE